MSQQAQPGWYADPQGVVRWWDGQQWTDHVQQAEQVLDPSNVTVPVVQPVSGNVAAAGSGSRSGLMWFFALVAVAAVGVAVYFATKGDDKDPQASTSAPVVNESSPPAANPTRTPGEAVTEMFSSMFRYDCETVISLWSQAQVEDATESAASADVSPCSYLGLPEDYDVSEGLVKPTAVIASVEESGQVAVVTFQFEDTEQAHKIGLVLEGGAWRIDEVFFIYDDGTRLNLRELRVEVESLFVDGAHEDAFVDFVPDTYLDDEFGWGFYGLNPSKLTYCIYGAYPESWGYQSIDQDGLIYEDRSCGQG